MLAEKPLPTWATGRLVAGVGGQTSRPVDDIGVLTEDGGWVCLQAKAGLNLGTKPASPLGSAMAQLVDMVEVGVPDRPPTGDEFRSIDPSTDRIAIVSNESAPATVRVAAAAVTDRLRALPDGVPVSEAAINKDEVAALNVLRAHVERLWLDLHSDPIDDAQLRAVFRLLAIRSLHLRDDGPDLRAVILDLRDMMEKPDKADALWRDLCEIGQRLADERAWLRRNDLVDELQTLGHHLRPTSRFRPDVKRLGQITTANVETPPAPITLRAPDRAIEVAREIADLLAEDHRNVAITGESGVGKSVLLHHMAVQNMAACDVVYLSSTQLLGTPGATRSELNLDHDLDEVLQAWTGSRPGLLLLDGIDQTRGIDCSQWLPNLAERLRGTRWRITATIRSFDLRRGRPWQSMFAGTAIQRNSLDAELSGVSAVVVTDFSEREVASIRERSASLDQLFATATPELSDLLKNPFNLDIASQLIAADPGRDMSTIHDRLDLLNEYWRIRVAQAPNGRIRQRVLQTLSSSMVSARVQYASDAGVSDAGLAELDRLISDGVLREVRHNPWSAPRPVVFSHPVWFDYACALNCLGDLDKADTVADVLDQDANLAMFLRPSLDMRMAIAWRADPTRVAFWQMVLRLAAGHILAAASAVYVAAAEIRDTVELDELRTACLADIRSGPSGHASTVAFLLAAAVGDNPSGVEAAAAFGGFMVALARTAEDNDDIDLAHLIAQLAGRATGDRTPPAGSALSSSLVQTAIAVTAVALSDLDDERRTRLALPACRALALAAAVDARAASATIRAVASERAIRSWGANTVRPLFNAFSEIAAQAPDVAADIGSSIWLFDDDRNQPTSMLGSNILGLTSNRLQDLDGLRHMVGQRFRSLADADVAEAARLLCAIVERRVWTPSPAAGQSADQAPTSRPRVRHGDALRYIGGHGTVPEMVDSLVDGLDTAAGTKPDTMRVAIAHLAEWLSHAEAWQRLLTRAAALDAPQVCLALGTVALPKLLAHAETWLAAGHIAARMSPLLDAAAHQDLEAAILAATEPAPDDEPRRSWLHSRRDMLLAALSPQQVIHPDAVDHLREISATQRVVPPLAPVDVEDMLLLAREADAPAPHDDVVAEVNQAYEQAGNVDQRHLANQRMLAVWPRLTTLAAAAPDDARLRTATSRCAAFLAHLPETLPSSAVGEQVLATTLAELAAPIRPDEPRRRAGTDSMAGYVETPRTAAILAARTLIARPAWRDERGAELRAALMPYLDDEAWVHRHLATPAIVLLFPDSNSQLEEAERRLAVEPDRHVAAMLINIIAARSTGPTEADGIFRRIFGDSGTRRLRVPSPDGSDAARDAVLNSVWGNLSILAIHYDSSFARSTVRGWLASPAENADAVITVVSHVRSALNPSATTQPDLQDRAFELLGLAIEPLRENWTRLETAAADDNDQRLARNTIKIAEHIAQQLHLASGATSAEGEVETGDPTVYADRAFPLLEAVASVRHPAITHHVVETAAHLSTARPKQALLLVKTAIVGDERYVYESLGVDAVLNLAARYMAEHRSVALGDPECTTALRLLIEGFVRVGWPQAIRMAEQLGEMYR